VRTRPSTPSQSPSHLTRASVLVYHRDHRMYEWTQATPIPIGPGQSVPSSTSNVYTVTTEVERPGSGATGLDFEAESGLGEESAGEFRPVLDALEPIFDDCGQLGGERLAR
jgi:hypothetical protein